MTPQTLDRVGDPLPYLGVTSLPVPNEMPQMVVLLCRPKADGRMSPVGTGFLIGEPAQRLPGIHQYLVTARHIAVAAPDLHARVRLSDGVVDVPVGDWTMSESAAEDVAITRFPSRDDGQHKFWSTDAFLSSDDDGYYLGDNIYFMGLLQFVPEMAAQNVPMVRSGTLGALNQTGIPVEMPGRVIVQMTGHLIDCRAYRGFSGSPCLIQDPHGRTRLLGVISAHLDASVAVPMQGDLIERAEVPIHSGVGVVAPVALLRALLDDERVAEMRDTAEDAMLEAQASEVQPATADSADESADEFQRFEALTQRLVNVPKSELDEKRKQDA